MKTNTFLTSLIFIIFSDLSLSSPIQFNESDKSISEKDERYICGELEGIKSELDNIYCSSSNDVSIRADCDAVKNIELSCSVEKVNDAVLLIHLGADLQEKLADSISNETVAGIDTRLPVDATTTDEIYSTLEQQHKNYNTKGAALYISLKCINSISNNWFCGLESSSYRHAQISKTNREVKSKLIQELLDMTSSCVSKI